MNNTRSVYTRFSIWILAVTFAGHTFAVVAETTQYINALATYVENKDIDHAGLARIIDACDKGTIANPFIKDEAEIVTAKWHAYETLQDCIEHASLSATQVCEWAKKTRAEEAKQRREREETRTGTARPWKDDHRTLAMGAGWHVCGVQTNQQLICWDFDKNGERVHYPPAELGPVLSIAMSGTHVCAVRIDGGLRCFDLDKSDGNQMQSSKMDECIPKDLGPVRSVSVERHYSCAVKEDSTARCWTNFAMDFADSIRSAPLELGLVRSVAVPTYDVLWGAFACAVLYDGVLTCWNPEGRLKRASIDSVSSISVGISAIYAIKDDNTLVRLNHELKNSDPLPPLAKVKSVFEGTEQNREWSKIRSETCAVELSGKVHCWDNENNPLKGHDGPAHCVVIVSKIACALLMDGSVKCWSLDGTRGAVAALLSSPAGVFLKPSSC